MATTAPALKPRQSSQPPHDTTSITTRKAPSCAANRPGCPMPYQGTPLVDSRWDFTAQCQALISSKRYRNGGAP